MLSSPCLWNQRNNSVNWLCRIDAFIMDMLVCIRVCFTLFVPAVDIPHKIFMYIGWKNVTNYLLTFVYKFTLRILEGKKNVLKDKTDNWIEFLKYMGAEWVGRVSGKFLSWTPYKSWLQPSSNEITKHIPKLILLLLSLASMLDF